MQTPAQVLMRPPCLQAQRKADALLQALSSLGDQVKQQTAPNKDLQRDIADLNEVNLSTQLQDHGRALSRV